MLDLVLVMLLLASYETAGEAKCGQDAQPHLLVYVREHQLVLCEKGQAVGSFHVRLAKNGIGKTRSGDGKLPTGRYSLGQPRASRQYGKFIPIGYPTRDQAARGLTGGGVGVHGPDRRARWLRGLVNLFDTTDGCVGLATDDDTNIVADWVVRLRVRQIEIE